MMIAFLNDNSVFLIYYGVYKNGIVEILSVRFQPYQEWHLPFTGQTDNSLPSRKCHFHLSELTYCRAAKF